MLDYGTKPSKVEVKKNSPSKSAEFYSVWLGYDPEKSWGWRNRHLKSSGRIRHPAKGGWHSNNGLSIFDRDL